MTLQNIVVGRRTTGGFYCPPNPACTEDSDCVSNIFETCKVRVPGSIRRDPVLYAVCWWRCLHSVRRRAGHTHKAMCMGASPHAHTTHSAIHTTSGNTYHVGECLHSPLHYAPFASHTPLHTTSPHSTPPCLRLRLSLVLPGEQCQTCSCSNNGTCVNGQATCNCLSPGFTGSLCDGCLEGYVRGSR